MTTQTEALKMALEGGGLYEITGRIEDIDKCIVHRSVIKEALAQQSNEQGCKHCNHSLYCGTKCKNCGKQSNEQVEPTKVRLWDSQWINVVNHDNCYQGWNKEDAINHAVKMTEKYIASNFAENTHPPVPTAQPELLFEVDGETLTTTQIALLNLYEFQQATGCDTAAEFLAQHKEPEQEPVVVKFPRHEKQSEDNWTIDPAFITRVKQSIDPETPWDFIPEMEQVETTLLALEVIPLNLYTTSPQRTWIGLSVFEINDLVENTEYEDYRDLVERTETKLKERNQ